jgi:hypothetical protein
MMTAHQKSGTVFSTPSHIFYQVLIPILCLLFALSTASAATNVSGTISSDTTWDLAGSPYILDGAVTVAQGVTLTLQPEVVVKRKLCCSFGRLAVNGTLVSDATWDRTRRLFLLRFQEVHGCKIDKASVVSPRAS